MSAINLDFNNKKTWFETVWNAIETGYETGKYTEDEKSLIKMAFQWIEGDVDELEIVATEAHTYYRMLQEMGKSEDELIDAVRQKTQLWRIK